MKASKVSKKRSARRSLVMPGALISGAVLVAGGAVAQTHGLKAPQAVAQANPNVFVMVELGQEPTAQVYARILDQRGRAATAEANAAAVAHLAVVRREQQDFDQHLRAAGLQTPKEVYRLQRTYNGVMMRIAKHELAALKKVPGVRGVHRMTPAYRTNAHSMPFLGVPQVWEDLGIHGEGIKVGIIDTGIDYIHTNFGGDGDYTPNVSNTAIEQGTFPTTRVVGGWDFAGSLYGTADGLNDIPTPDPDPMDGHGHGSHVAGTVGGYGVTTGGSTYTGPWDDTIDMSALQIGPGAAPMADLYALKIFGDVGDYTNLIGPAFEWAADPNQDGNFDDHLDVVNMSVGGPYGSPADPGEVIVANSVAAGVSVVVSAGNGVNNGGPGDAYFIISGPSSTPEVISVAAVQDGTSAFTAALHTLSPAADYPAVSADWGPALDETGVTGDLSLTTPPDACSFPAEDLTGQIAIIDRGTCSFTLKVAYAQLAGAAGAVIVNNVPGAAPGLGYTDVGLEITIPVVSIALDDGNTVKGDMASATVTATMNKDLLFGPNDADGIASFSSRGPGHKGGHVLLKPDIAAPGISILSTAAGTGTEGFVGGGTSMASPHVAGLMALLRQNAPTWTPLQLKAAIMNTATHDVHVVDADPQIPISPARQGTGRADQVAAVQTPVIAYDADDPANVSVSFHTLDVTANTTESRTVRLENMSDAAVSYDASYVPVVAPPGVMVTVPATPVVVPANGTVDVTVTLDVDLATLQRTPDPTVADTVGRFWLSEASGYITFVPASGPTLRVSAFAALRPASDMSATGPVDTSNAVDGVGTSTITLTGTGLEDDPATPPDPPIAVNSMVWPFELVYRAANDPPWFESYLPQGYDVSEADVGEIKSVGVNSDVALGYSVAESGIYFAIETHGPWGSLHETYHPVLLKAASADDWQIMLLPCDLGDWGWPPDSYTQCFYDLSSGDQYLIDLDVFNVVGSGVHTPVFMSDVMVQWFPAAWLGLTDEDSQIEFQVMTNSWAAANNGVVPEEVYMEHQDKSPLLRYDLAHPGVSFPTTNMFAADVPDAVIDVNYDMDAAMANHSGGVLLLHHHNANGTRGEVVPVDGMTCTSDADCPASSEHRVCDVLTGACVGCLDGTVCFPGEACDPISRMCVADCRSSEANLCPPGAFCDLADGMCFPDCRQQEAVPCRVGEYCEEATGMCVVANALVETSNEPVGENCPNGGVRIDTGHDMNGNGELDEDEIENTQYSCHGVDTVVSVSNELAGANCPNGGLRIDSGADLDGDGALGPDEIEETTYVCNGDNGVSGTPGGNGTDGVDGQIVTAPAEDDDGCGCRVPGTRSSSNGWGSLLALGLGAAIVRRRRSRRVA